MIGGVITSTLLTLMVLPTLYEVVEKRLLRLGDDAYARRVLRAMVVHLGDVALVGARDPRAVVEPYVELLLAVRANARRGGRGKVNGQPQRPRVRRVETVSLGFEDLRM